MKRALDLIAPVILVALLLGAWEAACRISGVPAYFLPAPSAVAQAMIGGAGPLFASAMNTLAMALAALGVAALIALPLAGLAGLSATVSRALAPLAVALQVTPVVAVAPLAVIWAGLDHPERAIVGLAAVVAFFPLVSGALTGLRCADPDLERLFDLYGAGRVQRLIRLRAPASVPFVLEGLKVAAGLSVIGAVVAEFVAGTGAAQGLAWRILEAGARLRTAEMFAALFALAALGAALHALLGVVEARVIAAWRGNR